MRHALSIVVVGLFYQTQAVAQELQVEVAAVKNLISEWNKAHTASTVQTLSLLYSETVNFYGASLDRSKCISIKRAALEKQKDFAQMISNEQVLSGYSSGVIRCDFVKTVSRNNRTVNYQAYLIVKQFGGDYFIVGESDLITDKNIKNEPDLGEKVAIKEVMSNVIKKADGESKVPSDASKLTPFGDLKLILLVGSLALGLTGILVLSKRKRKSIASRTIKNITKDHDAADSVEKGLVFEKFIVQQFDIYKGYFTLLDWRSDKFHRGVFPKSSQNPDLVYQYKHKDFVRTFAVECKYRSRAFNGSIQIMDKNNYKTYEAFHRNEMPVYIALGIGGEPNNPTEMYLIPFQQVKLEMYYNELSKYRKPRKFFYDMDIDRLT